MRKPGTEQPLNAKNLVNFNLKQSGGEGAAAMQNKRKLSLAKMPILGNILDPIPEGFSG